MKLSNRHTSASTVIGPRRSIPATRRIFAVLCSLSLAALYLSSLNGCSGTSTTTASSTTAQIPGLTTMQYSGTVTLPAGSTLTPDKVTVENTLGSVHPSSNGQFTLTGFGNGTQIALAISPSGNPMLMGWLDASHNTISADSTAQIYAFYALGGPYLGFESERQQYMAQIAKLPGFAALSQAIATEISTNPDAFLQTDIAVKSALDSMYKGITGITPHQRSGGVARPMGVSVSPGVPQSGATVQPIPPSQAMVVNSYRRRTHVFVNRVSETLNQAETADPAPVTDFELPPTVGTNSGVSGAVADIFNAYFGNQPTAYASVNSDPFNVPLVGSNDFTTYQVINLGPGGYVNFASAGLTSTQAVSLVQVSVAGYTIDALVPFLSNFVFGSGLLDPPAGAGADYKVEFLKDFENDLLAFTTSTPGLQDLITAGKYRDALDLVFGSVSSSTTIRNLFIQDAQKAAAKYVTGGFDPGKLSTAMQHYNVIMNAAGGVLQIFDSAVYSAQISTAANVEKWTVKTNVSKTTINPLNPSIKTYEQVTLTASVPGVDTTGFSYMWITSAQYGYLREVAGGGRTNQTSYCSSSAQSTYVSNSTPPSSPATDSVSVQAFTGPNCVAANSVSSAAATNVTITTTPADLAGWVGAHTCPAGGGLINTLTFYAAPFPPRFGSTPAGTNLIGATTNNQNYGESYYPLTATATKAVDARSASNPTVYTTAYYLSGSSITGSYPAPCS